MAETYKSILRLPPDAYRTENRVLVWSADFEHAVFDINDAIHPNAICVWFELMARDSPTSYRQYTQKYRKDSPKDSGFPYGVWGVVEASFGKIDFVYGNPFGKESAFGITDNKNIDDNFACIALDNPKRKENVGGVMRACHVFGASLVVISGNRINEKIRSHVDTTKAYKHIPTIAAENVLDAVPYGAASCC